MFKFIGFNMYILSFFKRQRLLTSEALPTLQRGRQGYQYYHKFFKTVYRHVMSSVIYYQITSTGNIEQTVAGCCLESLGCVF